MRLDEFVSLCRSNPIAAIKYYRNETKSNLAEAKMVVDACRTEDQQASDDEFRRQLKEAVERLPELLDDDEE